MKFRYFLPIVLAIGLLAGAIRAQTHATLLGMPFSSPTSSIALVHHTTVTSGSVGVATQTITLTGTAQHNLLTVEATYYNGIVTIPISVTTNNGTTCAATTNTFEWDGSNIVAIWDCPNNAASGSVTLTATYGGVGAGFPSLFAQEWSGPSTTSPDVGIGNHNATASTTSVSIATNGTTTQANQLILSCNTPAASAPTSIGGSQTALETSVCSYQLIDSNSATITHTYGYSGSQNVAGAIAAFGT